MGGLYERVMGVDIDQKVVRCTGTSWRPYVAWGCFTTYSISEAQTLGMSRWCPKRVRPLLSDCIKPSEKLSACVQMDEKAVQTPFDGSGRVHISFPAKLCPSRVVFVLKETEPEAWLNSGAGDFVAQLKPPDLSNLVDKVITAEATYTHWSLFNRFCMANDILDAADAAGEHHCIANLLLYTPPHAHNHCQHCFSPVADCMRTPAAKTSCMINPKHAPRTAVLHCKAREAR